MHHNFLINVMKLFIYSPSLVLIGVGSKATLSSAVENEEVHADANFSMAGGLASAFAWLNYFSYLHNGLPMRKDLAGDLGFDSSLRALTTIGFLIVAVCRQKPSTTMVSRLEAWWA